MKSEILFHNYSLLLDCSPPKWATVSFVNVIYVLKCIDIQGVGLQSWMFCHTPWRGWHLSQPSPYLLKNITNYVSHVIYSHTSAF